MLGAIRGFLETLDLVEEFVVAAAQGDVLLRSEQGPLRDHFTKFSTTRKTFDDTAFFISTSAALQKFVGDLARAYLKRLPTVRPTFDSLPQALKSAHRKRSAELLESNLDQRKHRDFSHAQLAKNLSECLAAEEAARSGTAPTKR